VPTPHILWVDDASETRTFLAEKILAPEGYRVTTAADGQEALGLALGQHFDLIIADYLMPHLTGLDLLTQLKRQGKHIPFMLITAEGSESLAIRAMRLGVKDYLIKPFDIDEFLAAIGRVLGEVTAQERLAQAPPQTLDLSQNHLAQMLWATLDPVLVCNEQGRLVFFNANAQTKLGLSDEAIKTHIHDAIQTPELLELLDQPDTDTQIELELGDKQTYQAQMTSIPHLGKVLILHDISLHKEALRTKNDFILTLSHDLRSPLTTILGYLELLGRVGTLTDQQKKFTEYIRFSVKAITNLLSDMLELSRIEAGADNALGITYLDQVIRYALENLYGEINEKDHEIIALLDEHTPPVLGNGVRLKQMISNLLQNAIKYTPPNGLIKVRLWTENGFVIFQVQDNGIGIPLEDQPRIWNKFYRATSVVGEYPGTGLGLSIVKTIVEAHAGRIWLESQSGHGTSFTVMLPVLKESSKEATSQ
jgi:signal transduction histidine kinase